MRKLVRLISDKLNLVVSVVTCILLAAILVCCTLQVFTRYVLNSSLYWSEEAARYIFVWCSLLGLSIAVKNGSNASIDVISGKLKGKVKRVQVIVVALIMIGICMMMLVYGVKILPTMARTVSAALLIPNNYLYVAVPIAAGITIIHCLNSILEAISGLLGKAEETGQGEEE